MLDGKILGCRLLACRLPKAKRLSIFSKAGAIYKHGALLADQ
jgi:hypothetical protein